MLSTSGTFVLFLAINGVLGAPTEASNAPAAKEKRFWPGWPSWTANKKTCCIGGSAVGSAIGGAIGTGANLGVLGSTWQWLRGQDRDDEDEPYYPPSTWGKSQPYNAPFAWTPASAPAAGPWSPQTAAGLSPAAPDAPPPFALPQGSQVAPDAPPAFEAPAPNQPAWKPAVYVPEPEEFATKVTSVRAKATAAASSKATTPLKARVGGQAIVCRKFPDTVISNPQAIRVIPANSPVNLDCWTSASLGTDAGKINDDPIWLRSSEYGCYINEAELREADYQGKLNYCMAPTHWIAGIRADRKNSTECYQCPSLKCPVVDRLGAADTIDVQCIVDGEEARGNNTWVKPIDENCVMPAETFASDRWLGTFGGKC